MTPEALAALHARAMGDLRPWSATEFAGLLASPLVHLSIAGAGRSFALGRSVAGESELLTLATDPAARRQGLGRAALAGFEAEAAFRGARTAHLEVAADNTPARALYIDAGWAEVGCRRGYYAGRDGAGADAILMARNLPAT